MAFFLMKFQISILGCGSALPTIKRNQSCQIINVNESEYMIDCGEGSQLMMRKMKKRFQRINQIFISHLHGDHYYGLMGYLSTLHLLGRDKEMTVYAPKGLKDIIEVHQKHSKSVFRFPLKVIELEQKTSELIYEDKKVSIHTIPLKHKIYCNGFLFKEKEKPRNIIPEKIGQYKISLKDIKVIKAGADFTLENGRIISNSELTVDALKPKSYAYCTDTVFLPEIVPLIEDVDCLYHESTFIELDIERAKKTKHSTAKQAAEIGSKAKVKQLVLGHFSARYSDMEPFLEEAKSIFSNSVLAFDGMEIEL